MSKHEGMSAAHAAKLTKLQAQISNLRNEAAEIENYYEHRKDLAAVGSCFRYQNSYDRKKWYGYVRIIAADPQGGVRCIQFEHRPAAPMRDGAAVTIKFDEWNSLNAIGNYESISADEFLKQWAKLMVALTKTRVSPAWSS